MKCRASCVGPVRVFLAVAFFASCSLLTSSATAQQRGSDVGGQPSKRRLTKMPRLVTFVAAEYPPEEEASGVEASVVLTIEIGATGKVTSVAVARSAGAK